MEKLIIIGANEFQKKLIDKAREMGYETHVFAWEEGAIAKNSCDFFYPISIRDIDAILNHAKTIRPIGVCSIGSDLANITVNTIAKELNLIGNSLDCILVTTNKFEMRKRLQSENLPCPAFQLVNKANDFSPYNINLPAIVKPVDRSGSRGIYKTNSVKETIKAINLSKDISFSGEVLVEEFIDGEEFSVEFISQYGKHYFIQITKKYTTGSPNFIERAHMAPAEGITPEIQKKIIETIEKSLSALNVTNGASHSEIKITSSGEIKIIEIASRMGGDYIGSDMVPITTGFDFVKNIIQVSINQPIKFSLKKTDKKALVFFILNKSDKIKIKKMNFFFPNYIKEIFIENKFKTTIDSSSRNGYFIAEITKNEDYDTIKEILNLC